MLDHDEERQLADIEAHLRDEWPDLLELFEAPAAQAAPATEPGQRPEESAALPDPDLIVVAPAPTHPVIRSILAVVAAVVLTTLVTIVVGPDLGGLVAVIGLSMAGMYAYQLLRGCPGLRRHRGES